MEAAVPPSPPEIDVTDETKSAILQLTAELSQRRCDVCQIRCLARKLQAVPDNIRSDIWQVCLGIDRHDHRQYSKLSDQIGSVVLDLPNQRVIKADAERTRPDFVKDGVFSPSTIESFLTYYCKRRAVRYKQGLNEVLAPFFLLSRKTSSEADCLHADLPHEHSLPLDNGVIFSMYYAFITRFLPLTYTDDEFVSLQCVLRLFHLLLLFHDPVLATHLEKYNALPEIYATPWLLTLLSRSLEPQLVFQLWDFYLVSKNWGYKS